MKTKTTVLLGVLAINFLVTLPAAALTILATDDVATAGPNGGGFSNAFQSGNFLKDEYQVDGSGAATGMNSLAGGGVTKWRAAVIQFDLTGQTVASIVSANLLLDLGDNRAGPGETQTPTTVRIRMLADSEDGWVDDDVTGAPFTPVVSLADGSVDAVVDANGEYSWDVTSMLTGPNGVGLNSIVGFVVDTTTAVVDKMIFQDLEDSRAGFSQFTGPRMEIIPEPGSVLLFLAGVLCLMLGRRAHVKSLC